MLVLLFLVHNWLKNETYLIQEQQHFLQIKTRISNEFVSISCAPLQRFSGLLEYITSKLEKVSSFQSFQPSPQTKFLSKEFKRVVFISIDCIMHFLSTGIPFKWRYSAPLTPWDQHFEQP